MGTKIMERAMPNPTKRRIRSTNQLRRTKMRKSQKAPIPVIHQIVLMTKAKTRRKTSPTK